jgi:hypothetical protein
MKVAVKLAQVVGLVAFLVAVGAVPAQATPIVAATVTPIGDLFRYDYLITFDPLDDEIAILTVNGLAGDATLVNEVAPAGFDTDYDFGLGLISFFPLVGSTFPTIGTLSGFGFDTARRSASTTFDALTIFGDTLSGPATGPLGPASPIPEPATGVLLTIGLSALGRRLLRKQKPSGR